MAKRRYGHQYDQKTGKFIVVELMPGDTERLFDTPKGKVTKAMRKGASADAIPWTKGPGSMNRAQKIARALWG